MLGSSTAAPNPNPSLNTTCGVKEITRYIRPIRNDVPGSPGGAQLRGQEVNWFSHRRETESTGRRAASSPPGPVKGSWVSSTKWGSCGEVGGVSAHSPPTTLKSLKTIEFYTSVGEWYGM